SGKATFLRLFNRLNETQQGFRKEGNILIDGESIYKEDIHDLRRRIGIVFSKPTALTGTVLDNLSFGLKIQNVKDKTLIFKKIKNTLLNFELWDYFEDDLKTPAKKLSSFRLQLLSLARVLIADPEIILFDQPTKELSEMPTRRFEGIIYSLKQYYTIILNPSSMPQAQRLSDTTAFLYNGNLIEYDNTTKIFTKPAQQLTENYIRGKLDY
ncbi:MAG: phosphate ABC transporter ATP-binding protein, partial [Saprospiraceae bacterium]